MPSQVIDGSDAEGILSDGHFLAEWRALSDHCPWPTTFQSPDFARAWYRTYEQQYGPVLVIGRDDGNQLVGLLPLARAIDGQALVAVGEHQAEYHGWVTTADQANLFPAAAIGALRERF